MLSWPGLTIVAVLTTFTLKWAVGMCLVAIVGAVLDCGPCCAASTSRHL